MVHYYNVVASVNKRNSGVRAYIASLSADAISLMSIEKTRTLSVSRRDNRCHDHFFYCTGKNKTAIVVCMLSDKIDSSSRSI